MKTETLEKINGRLIEALESGVNPWKKTWQAIRDYGMPHNLATGRNYSGSNLLFLSSQEVPCNSWVTFNQAQDLGGKVKKGAKGSYVVYWAFVDNKDDEDKKIPLLKNYVVFNALRDCEGLEGKVAAVKDKAPAASKPAEVLGAFLDREGIELMHGGDRAFYAPLSDAITMPHEAGFKNIEAYQATLAHEAVHATGHTKRLDRFSSKGSHSFGSENYAFEELVAEIGSCYLCAEVGIEPDFSNSASYLAGWAKKIRENANWIVSAGGKAAKAADYILNKNKEEKE
jgi:antirestriction protein ArdC